MNFINKRLTYFLLTTIFLLCFFSTNQVVVFAETGERIESFKSDIKINKDGTINVLENILYDFGGLEKHGIYRDLPYVKVSKDNKKFQMDFSDFTVIDKNNIPYEFSQNLIGEKIRLKIGDPKKFITGQHNYLISYKVAGALTYFSDHDELYWNVTGNDWPVPITFSTPGVSLPVTTAQNEIITKCFTGYLGSTEQACSATVEGYKIVFKTEKELLSNQGLTIVLSFPKNIVSILEPKEIISFWTTNMGKIIGFVILTILGILTLLWYVVYPLWLPIKWWKFGQDPSTSSGQVRAGFDPPKTKDGRSLSPEETGALIDERVDMRDICATIIDLARRGYFKIVEKKKNDFYFVRNVGAYSNTPQQNFEQNFLDNIFSDNDEIRIKDEDLSEAVKDVSVALYKQMVTDNFFPKNPDSTRKFYIVISVLGFVTLNFPLGIFSLVFGQAMPKKTILGKEQANIAESLKNFLVSQERQLEFQAKNQMFFEKLLPYAVAFGVEKVWAQRFKDIKLVSPDWYQGYYGNNFNSLIFYSSLNSSLSQVRTSATPTTSGTGFSSGFSGGSSGGGGGGGGGGSW